MSKYIYSTGKRKTCIARVFLKSGNGNIIINNTNNYFKSSIKSMDILKKPLQVLKMEKKLDIMATIKGGGVIGQAEALRHGISKALIIFDKLNEDKKNSFKKQLKKIGFLTRDSRKVERKKVGRRKARKREQYSKR